MTVTETRVAGSGFVLALRDCAVMTRRGMLRLGRVPDELAFNLVQPILFVLLFSYVFGGAIPLPGGGPFREYVVVAVFAHSLAFMGVGTGTGLAVDMSRGLIDRFRALPMAHVAVPVGRANAELLRALLVTGVLAIVGLLVGWRAHLGLLSTLAGFGLLLLFAYAMAWVGVTIGLSVRNPEVAGTAGLLWVLPLGFVSNGFVPISSMPEWLQPVAAWNPVTAVVTATRTLFGNPLGLAADPRFWPLAHPVQAAVIWSLGLIAVFVPLALLAFRSARSR
ncbi:ABC transporter [Spongiactinospora gelatinilytica]|uniref:Transport permease protein n=1 Tax=Spongiactinospora gelatinilytica TaxID=2666298 RepID=A0A2W2HNP6_9ACTN|nr:ABC transporter permease [Spongiactinospora gelatinilytica]PZG51388.1 ABC transporter [Spongiactinospora gelatinilytica]